MTHLVQILLPINDNMGWPFADETLRGIQHELAERFGGLTAFSRAPAKGIWTSNGEDAKDDIVIIEVMTETLDEVWWRAFCERTRRTLGQKELVIRSHEVRRF